MAVTWQFTSKTDDIAPDQDEDQRRGRGHEHEEITLPAEGIAAEAAATRF